MKSIESRVLSRLESGKTITPMQALKLFGCFRLAVAISRIRRKGYDVVTEIVHDGRSSYAKYFLNSKPK